MPKQDKMIDIHTHIIPCVDDGSKSLDESIAMLKEMVRQGVTDVIATSHINSNATKTTWEEMLKQYNLLKSNTKELPINIHLGAEVRYRDYLDTKYEDYKLANSKYLLIEFSWYTETDICGIAASLLSQGYIPIIAHTERYSYLRFRDCKKLKEMGVLLQVNSGALIGTDRQEWQEKGCRLVAEELADFVASDTHNMQNRLPNLKAAYELLKSKLDENYLKDIFYNNALKILNNE